MMGFLARKVENNNRQHLAKSCIMICQLLSESKSNTSVGGWRYQQLVSRMSYKQTGLQLLLKLLEKLVRYFLKAVIDK